MESNANIQYCQKLNFHLSISSHRVKCLEVTYPENDKKSTSGHVVRNLIWVIPRTKPVHSVSLSDRTCSLPVLDKIKSLAQPFTWHFREQQLTYSTDSFFTARCTTGESKLIGSLFKKPEVKA